MIARLVRTISCGLMTVSLSSCCCTLAMWRYESVPDKLEAVAIMGFGDRSECIVPNNERPLMLAANTDHSLWIRLVFADHLRKPVPERDVSLTVVNAFGEAAYGLAISSSKLTTGDDGFEDRPITLRAEAVGVYRVRADYADKNAISTSYSPPIIVIKE